MMNDVDDDDDGKDEEDGRVGLRNDDGP